MLFRRTGTFADCVTVSASLVYLAVGKENEHRTNVHNVCLHVQWLELGVVEEA